jgi:hypothetical protein
MNLIKYIENSQAITSLLGENYPISEIDLHEATIHRNGPKLQLRFDLSAVPKIMPSRWLKDANTMQVVLTAWDIDALLIEGFSTQLSGTVQVLNADDKYQLEFRSPDCLIRCNFSSLRIEHVSGYIKAN